MKGSGRRKVAFRGAPLRAVGDRARVRVALAAPPRPACQSDSAGRGSAGMGCLLLREARERGEGRGTLILMRVPLHADGAADKPASAGQEPSPLPIAVHTVTRLHCTETVWARSEGKAREGIQAVDQSRARGKRKVSYKFPIEFRKFYIDIRKILQAGSIPTSIFLLKRIFFFKTNPL